MQTTQTGSQKRKAAPKAAGGRVLRATPKPNTGDSRSCAAAPPSISAEERRNLIARVAYFRAEKRGFSPGCELQDWVEAEREVSKLIGGA